jgi:hypothetical protein
MESIVVGEVSKAFRTARASSPTTPRSKEGWVLAGCGDEAVPWLWCRPPVARGSDLAGGVGWFDRVDGAGGVDGVGGELREGRSRPFAATNVDDWTAGAGLSRPHRDKATAVRTSSTSRTGVHPSTSNPLVPADAGLRTEPGTAQTGMDRRAAASAV